MEPDTSTPTQPRPMRGDHINWNHLFYFAEVALKGSVKEAATKLNMASSTLSEHIQNLEQVLSVQLFERFHRKLRLTADGERLFRYSKSMFDSGRRMLDVVSPHDLADYPISIGVIPSPSNFKVYEFIGKFMSQYSQEYGPHQVSLSHATPQELLDGLIELKYDFCFALHPPKNPSLNYEKVATEELGLFVHSELFSDQIDEVLLKYPLFICPLSPEQNVHEFVKDSFRVSPHGILTSDYPGFPMEMCLAGRGVAVMSRAKALAQGDSLRELKSTRASEPLVHNVYVVWSQFSENSASVRSLKHFIATAWNNPEH